MSVLELHRSFVNDADGLCPRALAVGVVVEVVV